MATLTRFLAGRDVRIDVPTGRDFEFTWVEPGAFTMQGPPTKPNGELRDGPFRATLTRGFWLGRYPVTQAQWDAVTGTQPSRFDGCPDCPVEQVSWSDAVAFAAELGSAHGDGLPEPYRFGLPTEAQWEYACRSGTTTEFSTGDGEGALAEAGWYFANSGGRTHPVGQKAPNAWGFYDMHGNVGEWCRDWADDYPTEPRVDWAGAETGTAKMIRGGGFGARYAGGMSCSGGRCQVLPDTRARSVGVRLAIVRDC